ncbi:hypothetical protein EV360DRAFT_73093 [Lentinula raphanica]|nr:hypothetical protein EV360DRAFT_73093 [Lentinula raphanica]
MVCLSTHLLAVPSLLLSLVLVATAMPFPAHTNAVATQPATISGVEPVHPIMGDEPEPSVKSFDYSAHGIYQESDHTKWWKIGLARQPAPALPQSNNPVYIKPTEQLGPDETWVVFIVEDDRKTGETSLTFCTHLDKYKDGTHVWNMVPKPYWKVHLTSDHTKLARVQMTGSAKRKLVQNVNSRLRDPHAHFSGLPNLLFLDQVLTIIQEEVERMSVDRGVILAKEFTNYGIWRIHLFPRMMQRHGTAAGREIKPKAVEWKQEWRMYEELLKAPHYLRTAYPDLARELPDDWQIRTELIRFPKILQELLDVPTTLTEKQMEDAIEGLEGKPPHDPRSIDGTT